jgi:hypothetical protein
LSAIAQDAVEDNKAVRERVLTVVAPVQARALRRDIVSGGAAISSLARIGKAGSVGLGATYHKQWLRSGWLVFV